MGEQGENIGGKAGTPKPFFSGGEGDSTTSYGGMNLEAGAQIGPFKVLGVLGEGGYGIVYLAQQEEPIRRRVALKIVKPGMDSKQVIARFEAERQALALLDHPNIAHVYDAGTTARGRPYFAMEYIEGTCITEYCDTERLSIQQRLRLFLQICHALQHAHQKGIIHRDIKPSNILVSAENGETLVKVIDFGVAKALTQSLTDKTLYTEQGQFIGTPDYMSPEQAELDAQQVDTRSDVYSLGVVLYELLSGVLPFDPKELRAGGISHIRTVIQGQEPTTPSTRLTSLGEDAQKIAERRQTDPQTLARSLRRELEWIPLKAMRKERPRRYQSASELAYDIENYLEGLPLNAGPESVLYRSKKYLSKHIATVVAATAIVLLLVTGLVVSTVLYLRAEESRRAATERAESLRRSDYGNRIALAQSAHREGVTRRAKELLASCPEDLRGWEWQWLSYVSDGAIKTLKVYPDYPHVKEITSIVLSPDGQQVFTAGVKGGVQVWDLESDSEVMRIFVGEWIWSIDLDPTATKLVTGTMGGTIQLWDAATGEEIMVLQAGHGEPYSSNKDQIYSVAFSPEGKRVVSGGRTIDVWDVATGQRSKTIDYGGTIRDVTFSPDGRQIASSSWDHTARVWDIESGDELATLEGHRAGVMCIAYSPDGTMIATGDKDSTIKLWRVSTGKNLATFYGHSAAYVWSVAFSPDNRRLVSGGSDGTVRVWDVMNEGKPTTLRGHGGDVTSVVFTPDGRNIVSGSYDLCVKLWNPAIRRGRTIVPTHAGWVLTIAFSPDGKYVFSGSQIGLIKKFDVATASEVTTMHGHTGEVKCVACGPEGGRVVSAGADFRIVLWDGTTGEQLMVLTEHRGSVNQLAYSPDGSQLVSASDDKTIKLWDISTGELLLNMFGHDDPVWAVNFSPSGDKIVSGDADGIAKIWDAASGQELLSIEANERRRFRFLTTVAFTPDGKHIVTGARSAPEKALRFWNATTGKEIMNLNGIHAIYDVAFTPDKKRILAGSNGVVAFWDLASGDPVLTMPSPGRTVFSLDVAPNGTTLALANEDGTISLLECEPPPRGFGPRIAAEAASKLVYRLYSEYEDYNKVLKQIRNDETLDESVREFGLQIANSRRPTELVAE